MCGEPPQREPDEVIYIVVGGSLSQFCFRNICHLVSPCAYDILLTINKVNGIRKKTMTIRFCIKT